MTVFHHWWEQTAMTWPESVEEWNNHQFDGNGNELSYESLVLLGTSMVSLLRNQMKIKRTSVLAGRDCCPIVVALPHGGPILALVILAIHVLNEPNNNCNNNQYAVLVTMDPNEGNERCKRMLQECSPAIILVMPGKDMETMYQLIQEMNSSSSSSSSISPPDLLNASELLANSMEKASTIDRVLFQQQLSSIPNTQDLSTTILQLEQQLLQVQKDENIMTLSHNNSNTTAHTISISTENRLSHICFTSGSTGIPKGCQSSIFALRNYILAKNQAHSITFQSKVLLASTISFDPCFSDILATFYVRATVMLIPRHDQNIVPSWLQGVTHVLTTPTVWNAWTTDWNLTAATTTSSSCCSTTTTDKDIHSLLSLQVIALGGEPIPKKLVSKWARHGGTTCSQNQHQKYPQLFATYGVTEACVYQTMGEVLLGDDNVSHVGTCMYGNHVKIVPQQGGSLDINNHGVGEVVLFGTQVDEYSGYVNRPELTKEKFILEDGQYLYKTGDLGYLKDGNLHIVGRIHGQEGMVKVNGVRIELGEVEAALMGLDYVVSDCMAVARISDNESPNKQIQAFIVLTIECLTQLKLQRDSIPETGVLCSTGPLLVLLRAQCRSLLRIMPFAFVIIPRVPVSPTGKCDRTSLPQLSECTLTLDRLIQGGSSSSIPLWDYGESGVVVAEQIIECLNLQGCQKDLVTTTANFSMLGGDSLGSTRIVRALYAYHHRVPNTRDLGGAFGTLEGPFAVSHLITSKTMQEYVDWLDSNGVCGPKGSDDSIIQERRNANNHHDMKHSVVDKTTLLKSELFDALLETITMSQFAIALELLIHAGVDPNFGAHGGRLSKIHHRIDRRKTFTSNPLHLACSKGHFKLVETLLQKGCKFNTPDASGMFPIHIAASGTASPSSSTTSEQQQHENDQSRRKCLELLLDAGAPLSMKDGSKQTVLHGAARAGNVECLLFLLAKWKQGLANGSIYNYNNDKHKGGEYDWTDHWYRTPVHWAVLNGKVDALAVLLEGGCSAEPAMLSKQRSTARTSAELESPLEICQRLYGGSELGDRLATLLLKWKEVQEKDSSN